MISPGQLDYNRSLYGIILHSKQNIEILNLEEDDSTYTIELGMVFPNRTKVTLAAISNDADLLAFKSGSDSDIVIWNIANKAESITLQGQTVRLSGIYKVLFSPSDKHILAGTTDGTLYLWDITSGSVQHIMKGHSRSILMMRFIPSINAIASTSKDNLLRIWRWPGDCSGAAFYLGSHVVDMYVSESGKDLIVSDGLNRIHVLSLESF
jgi:WD40 repeat protein